MIGQSWFRAWRSHFFGQQRDGLDLFGPALGNFPILAETAAEVAAGRGQGIGLAAGMVMEQRFFFDRVDMHGARLAVNQGIINAVTVFTHAAAAPFQVGHLAFMGAEPALDFFFGQFFVIHGLAGLGDKCGRGSGSRHAQQQGGGQRRFPGGF